MVPRATALGGDPRGSAPWWGLGAKPRPYPGSNDGNLMTDLFAAIRQSVLAAVHAVVPGLPDDVTARIEVSPTRETAHGDMATNAAMVCAKAARQPPVKLAAAIAEALWASPDIAEAI